MSSAGGEYVHGTTIPQILFDMILRLGRSPYPARKSKGGRRAHERGERPKLLKTGPLRALNRLPPPPDPRLSSPCPGVPSKTRRAALGEPDVEWAVNTLEAMDKPQPSPMEVRWRVYRSQIFRVGGGEKACDP